MPAYSDEFPWPSHYGHFNFFEERMSEHGEVTSYEYLGDGLYNIARDDGGELRVFICECYSYGMAEYEESVQAHGNIDAIIINSNWCGYTPELKKHCREREVGVFNIRDFMAALNREKYWLYLSEDEKDQFERLGWI